MTELRTVLAGNQVTNPFIDPVINPVSELTLVAMNLFNPLYGPNAALAGVLGISDNIQPALTNTGTEVQAVFTGGGFLVAELSAIQGDFGTILNNLELAPTTVLDDDLNGFPFSVAANGG